MPLIDFRKLNKSYRVRVKCTNCNEIQELNIPKGETVQTFIDGDRALCNVCGCNTLELKKADNKTIKK